MNGRKRLLARLRRAPDRDRAIACARSERHLVDDDLARLALARFDRDIRERRENAVATVRAAWAIAQVARTPVSRSVAWRLAGVRDHLDGQHRRARQSLERAADLLERQDLWNDAGDVHRVLIDVAMHLEDDAGARKAARRASTCYDRSGETDARRRGSVAMNLGNLHHRRDRHRQALSAYDEARRLFLEAGEPLRLANVDFNRANILTSLDRIDEARDLYSSARDRFRESGRIGPAAQAENALAVLDLRVGRLDQGLNRLRETRREQARIEDRIGMAHVDLDAGEAYLRLNRPAEADETVRRALAFFRRAGHRAEEALCLGLLGAASLQRGRPREASRHFRSGLRLHERLGNAVGQAILELGLAQAEAQLARYAAAADRARRSARRLARQGLGARESRAWSIAADAAAHGGRRSLARRWAERALDLARRRRDLRTEFSALMVLGRIERDAGRSDQAFRRFRAAERCVEHMRLGITAEESRLAFALDKCEVYEALVLNRLERGDRRSVRQALEYAERGKARALAERLQRENVDVSERGSKRARDLVRQLDALEQQLALAESRLDDTDRPSGLRRSSGARLETLAAARSGLLERLTLDDPARANLRGAPVIDPLAGIDRLGADELILEYVFAEGQVHLFAVETRSIAAWPNLARVDEVREAVELLRFQLGKGILGDDHSGRFAGYLETTTRRYLSRLHDLLLSPVTDRLEGRRLRIVPHGLLHGLPFHALERRGVPLIENNVVSYVPSLSVMALLERGPAAGSADPVILGVPDRAAPQIEREVETVSRHFRHARVFRGDEATRDALRAGDHRHPLLHVACHGFYSDSGPWSSGLRLGDAWLSLPELYSLTGTAELVVLSGCETGRGTVYSGDEWVGLVRGFLQAGARAVVASLWEVQDAGTVTLMDDFYAGLAHGQAVGEALAGAQRRARRQHRLPLHWAPFVVIGDPTLTMRLRKVA